MAHQSHLARARQLAQLFGQIADTTEWNHACWLALFARLLGPGIAPAELTLADVQRAIEQTSASWPTGCASAANGGPRALS